MAESATQMTVARQRDPRNPQIYIDLALPYFLARQYEQSIAESRKGAAVSEFLPFAYDTGPSAGRDSNLS